MDSLEIIQLTTENIHQYIKPIIKEGTIGGFSIVNGSFMFWFEEDDKSWFQIPRNQPNVQLNVGDKLTIELYTHSFSSHLFYSEQLCKEDLLDLHCKEYNKKLIQDKQDKINATTNPIKKWWLKLWYS